MIGKSWWDRRAPLEQSAMATAFYTISILILWAS